MNVKARCKPLIPKNDFGPVKKKNEPQLVLHGLLTFGDVLVNNFPLKNVPECF